MSSNIGSTKRPPQAGTAAAALQLGLAVLYPVLAHLASVRDSAVFAALAGVDVVVMFLAAPLLQWRPAAWAGLAVSVAGLAWLAGTRFALVPLLLMPVLFIVMIGWIFARSLRPPRQPLITRIAAALEGRDPAGLEPEIQRYTRRLTLVWAGVLAWLAMVNLVLALVAVPKGLLAVLGVAAPLTVTEAQWSWFANGLNYGLIGAVFVLEYLYRGHRFPRRYASLGDFLRRVAGLSPSAWRDLLR